MTDKELARRFSDLTYQIDRGVMDRQTARQGGIYIGFGIGVATMIGVSFLAYLVQ